MVGYSYRIMNAFFGTEFVPAFVRTKLMRIAGFDVSLESSIWGGCSFRSRKLHIGPGVFINVGFYHDGYDALTIADNVRIGPHVRVITATHEIGPSHQRGQIEVLGKPVRIEDGCWVGAGVVILPGVTVARGCVLAACAVIYEDTDPDGLYAGNPARRVRDLDP